VELKEVVEERLRYYHESRLHSGLGYRTPKEVMEDGAGLKYLV
jgi:putative transposase